MRSRQLMDGSSRKMLAKLDLSLECESSSMVASLDRMMHCNLSCRYVLAAG